MKTCVFAGTFDPFTNGHAFVIEKCVQMFDKVVVAVGVNVDKKPLFSVEQRMDMIKATFKGEKKVEVKAFSGMLTDFMKENEIFINVRGIRDRDDYKYETTMARYNEDMYPEIITVYLPTPKDLTYVSSSAVRNIIDLKSDFSNYVPKAVYDMASKILKEKY
ncbi:MAG: pantetheine-phosphate adenylyltransferase [Clostridia bacterium]|nr:pantetheine-phosphate adenylyltransferase [Clostridia bacterium]